MAQQESDLPLGNGLFCHLEKPAASPDHAITLSGSDGSLHLTQHQALALFRVLLSSLDQIGKSELQHDSELYEVHLVSAFHRALERLNTWPLELLDETDLLQQAHEHYQHTYDLQDEMLTHVNAWELALERQYSRLEDASAERGMSFDELDEDFEDDLEDQS